MNTLAHTALSVQQFLTINSMTPMHTLPIHPISSCMTFFVSPDEKAQNDGTVLPVLEEAKQKAAEVLKGSEINEFRSCFEQWKKHLDRCIASNGECFEGD